MINYKFCEVSSKDIRVFIEDNHYSKSINGVKISHCFALFDNNRLVGAALFGQLSTTAWKRYSEEEGSVVELRRLVCLDECPGNTESWFISKCLKWMKKNTKYKVCVSYADPRHGHIGYVYQAANWNYHGQTANDTILITPEGKEYHSRAMRTKYKGELKPFAKRLKAMWDEGVLKVMNIPGKHIYTYCLLGRRHLCTTSSSYPK